MIKTETRCFLRRRVYNQTIVNLRHANVLTRKTLTAVLSIWLSGIVLLFVCDRPMPVFAMDHCPLMKLGAHCDRPDAKDGPDALTNQTDPDGIDCCAFIPAFFDKTRVFDSNQQVVVGAQASPVVAPGVYWGKVALETTFTYHPKV